MSPWATALSEVAEVIGNEMELDLLTWRIICGTLGEIIEFT